MHVLQDLLLFRGCFPLDEVLDLDQECSVSHALLAAELCFGKEIAELL
jgi:hypothetical protein